jgi:uncharacterized protein (DUF983 family)
LLIKHFVTARKSLTDAITRIGTIWTGSLLWFECPLQNSCWNLIAIVTVLRVASIRGD